jgi:hypothetical protein
MTDIDEAARLLTNMNEADRKAVADMIKLAADDPAAALRVLSAALAGISADQQGRAD